MNPARNRVSDYRPSRVTVATIVYLPHLTGYFQNRLDVVRLSFETLFQNTNSDYDLLVFDNASCTEVKTYLQALQAEGRIRYLLSSSENIGKLGALRVISGAAPGDLIAYADDDTFFYPGWLQAHLQVYDHFPNVGMVSGSPERTLFDHGIQSNLKRAATDSEFKVTYGKRIPVEWEREWAIALGKDEDAFLQEVEPLEDIVLEYRDAAAYATACHNQFLSPKSVMLDHLIGSWSGRLEMATEARRYGIQVGTRAWSIGETRSRGFLQRLAKGGPIRWLLQGIYNRLFWILSGQSGAWVELETDEEAGK
jgi:hypothetical protein